MKNLPEKIKKLSKNLISYNDENLMLIYERGKCTLQDLIVYKLEH